MRSLKSLLTLICIVLFSSTLQAEDITNPQLNRGVKLFNEKRYAEATRLLIPLAEAENETALKLMSQAYQYGRGVPENKQKTLELLRKAAAIESDGSANYALGIFHLKGSSGAEKDEKIGLSYIERANELRHAGAFKVLEANFPGKYSLGQRGTRHQESNPSKQTAPASGEVPLAAGSIFEGKNPCPGQNGLVKIQIESIQNKTSPGPVAVDATIIFDFNKSKINKPITAKYFPEHGKLALYNAGPTMRPAEELSETLSLEVASDGRHLSGNFVAPNTLENKENSCSKINLSIINNPNQIATSPSDSAKTGVAKEFPVFNIRPGMTISEVTEAVPAWCIRAKDGSFAVCPWAEAPDHCDSIEFAIQAESMQMTLPSARRTSIAQLRAECKAKFYYSENYNSRFVVDGLVIPRVLLKFSGNTLEGYRLHLREPSFAERIVTAISTKYGKPTIKTRLIKEPVYETRLEHTPYYKPGVPGYTLSIPVEVITGEVDVVEKTQVWVTRDGLEIVYSDRHLVVTVTANKTLGKH